MSSHRPDQLLVSGREKTAFFVEERNLANPTARGLDTHAELGVGCTDEAAEGAPVVQTYESSSGANNLGALDHQDTAHIFGLKPSAEDVAESVKQVNLPIQLQHLL